MDDVENFDLSTCRLAELQCDVWAGWFLCHSIRMYRRSVNIQRRSRKSLASSKWDHAAPV